MRTPEGGDERSVAAIDREQIVSFYEIDDICLVARRSSSPATSPPIAPRSWRTTRSSVGLAVHQSASLPTTRPRATSAPYTSSRRATRRSRSCESGTSAFRAIIRISLPVNVMNAVLGGLFNSRINLNLREAHGYTYGAFSAFEWRRQAGPFVVSTAVKSDITDAAAREVLCEIDRIRAEAIGPDELSLATSYLDGVFPIRFETTSAIAAALSVLVIHGLPDDYYDRYRRTRARGDGRANSECGAAVSASRRDADGRRRRSGRRSVPIEKLGFGSITLYDTLGHPTA